MSSKEVTFALPWGNVAGKMWTKGVGPNVLCIHGYFSNSSCYDRLITSLLGKVGGNWCSIDLPGTGRSDNYPPGVLIEIFQCVLDLQRIILSLEWTDFHIISHSAGTTFGICLTSAMKDQVKSYIAIDFMSNFIWETPLYWERVQNIYLRNLDMRNGENKVYSKNDAIEMIKTSRLSPLSDEYSEIILDRSGHLVKDGYILKNEKRYIISLTYPSVTGELYEALLKEITCPILMIQLSEFPLIHDVPSNLTTFRILGDKLGSKFQIKTIEGSHDIFVENPKEISEEILSHFTRNLSKI